MSLDPGLGHHDAAAEVRHAARRHAERWAGSGPMIVGALVVTLLMAVFILLDYTLDQDPHRVVKVAVGALAMGVLFMAPRQGLLLLPLITPFLAWVPPTPVPGLNALNMILFTVFGSFAYSRIMARQPVLKLGRLGPAILMLLGLALLSIIRGGAIPTGYGYKPFLAFNLLIRSGMTFMTYFIVLSMLRGEKDRVRITWAVLLGLLLEGLAVIAYGRNGPGGRAIGSIGQANELGGFLALYAIMAGAMAVGARSWYARLVSTSIFGIGSFGIMLSLSRGSMLALVAGLGFVLWRSSKLALAIVLAALLAAPLWVPDYVIDRVKGSKVESEESGVAVDRASESRIMTWRAIMEVITHHPIDGVGFTGLGSVLPDVGASLGLTDVQESAHNTYLRMLGELGVGGLILFVLLLWRSFRLSLLAARKAKSRFDRAAACGFGGAILSMAVSCAFGDRFWSPVVVSNLWIMAAVIENSLDHPANGAAA